jgi:hypothetical protein
MLDYEKSKNHIMEQTVVTIMGINPIDMEKKISKYSEQWIIEQISTSAFKEQLAISLLLRKKVL